MSWMYGDDYQYALSRLEGTVVTHAGVPVIVLGINGRGQAHLAPLKTELGPLFVDAKEIDCTPVQLGYVNYEGTSIFCSRVPARRYRQGLSEVTLHCMKNGGVACGPLPMNMLDDCIRNIYKPYGECVLREKAQAWHRNWASSNKKLYYKGGLVGITDAKGKPVLSAQYEYLQEALDEDCNAMVRG